MQLLTLLGFVFISFIAGSSDSSAPVDALVGLQMSAWSPVQCQQPFVALRLQCARMVT